MLHSFTGVHAQAFPVCAIRTHYHVSSLLSPGSGHSYFLDEYRFVQQRQKTTAEFYLKEIVFKDFEIGGIP